jgi:hypothetical protein
MSTLVALYRNPTYSPLQHRTNDSAILEETTIELAAAGWKISVASEIDVARGRIPAADVYLNMCQGLEASEELSTIDGITGRVVNRPSSVLRCHRRRLVETLVDAKLPFPRTLIAKTTPEGIAKIPVDLLTTDHDPIWVKRGDVHAERPEDVVVTDRDGLTDVLTAFARRGIGWAALQMHVPGPILKFYGVADGRFFRWYPADGNAVTVDEARLREVAFGAAAALGLEIFGGDVALPAPDQPVIIDVNDWPSFARFRNDAARAIAGYIHDSFYRNGASD